MKRLRKISELTMRDITYTCDEILRFILNNCEENYIYFYVHECLSDDRMFGTLCNIIKEKINENTSKEELEYIIKTTIIEIAKKQQQMRYEME